MVGLNWFANCLITSWCAYFRHFGHFLHCPLFWLPVDSSIFLPVTTFLFLEVSCLVGWIENVRVKSSICRVLSDLNKRMVNFVEMDVVGNCDVV